MPSQLLTTRSARTAASRSRIALVAAIAVLALARIHTVIPSSTSSTTSTTARSRALRLLSTLSYASRLPISLLKRLLSKAVTYFQDHVHENGSLAALHSLLSTSKIESFLLAFLPVSHFGKRFASGNMVVDMFVNSAVATLIISGGTVLVDFIKAMAAAKGDGKGDSVSIRVEFLRRGPWYYGIQNEHHTALSWLISQKSNHQSSGRFRMVPFENEYADDGRSDDDDDYNSAAEADATMNKLDFNLVPSSNETDITITDEGHTFNIWFDYSSVQAQQQDRGHTANAPPEPPIVVQRVGSGPTNLDWMKQWLTRVSNRYIADQKKRHVRGRHEYDPESGWKFIHPLHSSRGLQSVSLDEVQERLLVSDLDTFVSDQDFYKRMGLPYRRGLMFSGKPGTGKTSLINAISAAHNRDIYMINLKAFKDDKSLQNAFSRVPANGIIVFEDVDAQSRCVWDRERRKKIDIEALMGPLIFGEEERALRTALTNEPSSARAAVPPASPVPSSVDDSASDTTAQNSANVATTSATTTSNSNNGSSSTSPSSVTPPSSFDDGPTLATLLNCLDGHSSAPGIIVIFTTNHPEVLDPALTRPGRIDLHLSLGYCTHHQLTHMFRNVTEDADASCDWSGVEEGILPPCESMRIMILNRRNPDCIADLIRDRCREIMEGRIGVASGGAVVAPTAAEAGVSK